MKFLLCCMDYRYPRRIIDAMRRFNQGAPYFQFVLAGASLGACVKDWQDVFFKHVDTVAQLGYSVDELIILDHRDCGAYRHPRAIGVPPNILEEGLGEYEEVLPRCEMEAHQGVLNKLVPKLQDRFDNVPIRAWLLARNEDDPLKV